MIVLPQKFEEILKQDTSGYYAGAVDLTRSKFGQIFSENRLYFFEEYTDHGINHINSVLKACAELITKDTYKLLSEKDISILVLSVFLHDLGMHLQPLTFKKMVTGGYDDVLNPDFGDQKWSVLWENYLFEAKKFNDQQRIRIFGDACVYVSEPSLDKPDTLTGFDKKLIGEFIRRHHPRIAFEVAFKGLTTHEGTQIDFCSDFDHKHKLLAGLLARSHGMNIRDTFPFLEKHFTKRVWRRPLEVHIFYLMSVLRLADYFQINAARVLKVPFLTRHFQSPVSFAEHQKHLQTTYIQPSDDDPETLFITAEPINSTFFLALENLFRDIQKEVDNSWAVLGEVYGLKSYDEQPKLAYRRIRSNIDDKKFFESTVPYVPEKISFTVDKEVPKLLIGPLYNYDPSFGVRELLQNAVDACWERESYEKKLGNDYKASIVVKIEPINDKYLFSIIDNGKGMTLDEICNYFLKIGGSFRKSVKWQLHIDHEGHSNVNKSGRFGVGVLAAYLLGSELNVKTKSIYSSIGYNFKTVLDQEQIEILKEKDFNYGTFISIILSKRQFKKLIDNNNRIKYRSEFEPMRFDNWYVLNSPLIIYNFPDSKLDDAIQEKSTDYFPAVNEENEFWHEIKHPDYKKIVWSYHNNFFETIICNGFVVPGIYDLDDDRFRAPTILVFDYDAKLPINLNRTSVDYPLPFNGLLFIDICKDIIAALLIKEVENVFITHRAVSKNFSFTHPALTGMFYFDPLPYALFNYSQLILGRNGFFINHSSVFEQLMGLNYLRIFKHDSNDDLKNQLNIKYLFEKSGIDLISASYFRDEDHFSFNDLLKNIGALFLKAKDKEILGWTDSFYSALSKKKQSQVKFDRNIIKEFLKKNSENVSLVYYKYSDVTLKHDAFSKILFELLGDDLLIPYNIEDRKKKFPKAFKELEPYMKKYLEKK